MSSIPRYRPCRLLRVPVRIALVGFGLLALGTPDAGAQLHPRLDHGALLEPAGVVVHGAGQDPDSFERYWNVMEVGHRPAVYMHYISLRDLNPDWADALKAELLKYRDRFVIPQIGLSMTSDGNPEQHYENLVAQGVYDEQIDHLIEGFRRMAYPAYLRIGYEFNGVSWNGYAPDSYRAAFMRITDRLREADVEVATVWCGAMDGVRTFFDFYPGDEYVDWFGIDIFSVEHFLDPDAAAFLDSAAVHGRPVMIGETTPRYVGAQNGSTSWNGWFRLFFDFMRSHPQVKLFSYINWDWAYWSARIGADWSDWGDARLETASVVRTLYREAIRDTVYYHASLESDFRRRLAFNDDTPPPGVGPLTPLTGEEGTAFSWAAVSDESGLSHYILYRNGELLDYTLETSYADPVVSAGRTTYEITAMDRAGNETMRSEPLVVDRSEVERIRNGDFEAGVDGWMFERFSSLARASFVADTAEPLSGLLSGRVNVSRSTGTDWHVQLRQLMPLVAGHAYRIQFIVRAEAGVTVPLVFQQSDEPHEIYSSYDIDAGPVARTYSFDYRPGQDAEDVAFSFFLGAAGSMQFWFDEVSVVERVSTGTRTEREDAGSASGSMLLGVYPNPMRSAGNVSFSLPEQSLVVMAVFDVLGRRVLSAPSEWYEAGDHRSSLDVSQLPAGVYVLCLDSGAYRRSETFAVLGAGASVR